ncbi:hypothetical protein RI138_23200 [Streptomyces sp. C11-1]|uniref:Uncharacterized protein n=1 Tax=Streptomyces durocortorensis TaxID=2811104 RepID=A0ABY9W019_9ACTN|nr:hypothetical protein [Streptomyces durocortorensis]WNF29499.1 hypothetical protein RI138_23200 [Streptomyces durocortorensis]
MSASAAADPERPTPSGVLAALYRAIEPTEPVETARALVGDRSVRIALCLDCPDELEAIGRALGICLRMLGHSPEFSGYGITDCRLL